MSWVKEKGLKEERAKHVRNCAALVDKGTAEKRTLTATEDAAFQASMRSVEMIDAELRADGSNGSALSASDVLAMSRARREAIGASPIFGDTDDNSEARALRKDESTRSYLTSRGQNLGAEVGPGAFMRAIIDGPKSDAEKRAVSDGQRAPGVFELPVGSSADILDSLRTASAVMIAGATVIPLIGVQNRALTVSTEPTATVVSELSVGAATDNFVSVAFSPKVVRGVVKVSRETLADTVNVDATVKNAIVLAVGRALDAQALGVVDGQSTLSVAAAGTLTNYSKLLDCNYALATAYSDVTGVILHPRDMMTLAKLSDTTNQPMRPPAVLAALPFVQSSVISIVGGSGAASTVYVGDWSKLLIGTRTSVEFQVLNERYSDLYAVGLAYSVRFDSVLARPKGICRLTGVL
jgi:HK97 family phage major capsid protein